MATTVGTHLTRAGFDILAKAVAGKQLRYSKVQFGDSERNGRLVEPTRAEEYEFTTLINPKSLTLPIIDCKFAGAGTAVIKFKRSNVSLATGFFAREIGVFAFDPDTGTETLYCYCNFGNLCDYVPPADSGYIFDEVMAVTTVVAEATNVTAVLDTSLAYITTHEFDEHINSTAPHPNTPTLKNDVTTTGMFWATSEDSHLHRISLANTQRLILGGDAALLPQMERRITQTEINVANLYMQLDGETELGLKPNLMLVEDFADNSTCDQYECKVVGEVAGVHGVQIENDNDILAGHWYTITDGTRSEYVRVKSIAKNSYDEGSVIVAIFESKLAHTYNLNRTRLMRSTVLLQNNRAFGAGEVRSVAATNSYGTWKGSGANTLRELTLDTSQDNKASFKLSGEYGFTTDGEFTINVAN